MEGWRSVPLSECIQRIATPTKIPRKQFEDAGQFPIVSQEKEFINGYWSDEAAVIPVDSPLVVFGDHTQVLKYIDFDFVVGADGVKLLQPKSFLDAKYFYYFLIANPIADLGYARHYRLLKELDVRFPRLFHEQVRIVAILDEAFEAIATATANAQKSLANVRELFESHLKAVFTHMGDGWVESPLISLCSLFVDSAHRTPKYQTDGMPALRPRDVVNGTLVLGDAAHVSQEEYDVQSKRHKPRPGDIVYSRELSYGWAAILPESPRVCLSQGMCIFRPTADLDGAFLVYVLNGPVGREQAQHAAVGTAHPHINLGDIKSYKIPMPPLEEQQRIITHLDGLTAETQRLESTYRRKLASLAELKQSILHKAFMGELTADGSAADRTLSEASV